MMWGLGVGECFQFHPTPFALSFPTCPALQTAHSLTLPPSLSCHAQGEHCSFTVQMWMLHMRALQHDLWTYLPLMLYSLREEILVGVLKACLSHLASRYSQMCPSPQYIPVVL